MPNGLTTPPVALIVVPPNTKLLVPPGPGAVVPDTPVVPPAPITTVATAPGVTPIIRFLAYPPPEPPPPVKPLIDAQEPDPPAHTSTSIAVTPAGTVHVPSW